MKNYESNGGLPRSLFELPGIGEVLANRIANELGDGDAGAALSAIQTNPYALTDVDGIGFKKADKIALEVYGIDQNAELRHYYGNRFIVKDRGVMAEAQFRIERRKLGLINDEFAGLGVDVESGKVWLPEELEAETGLALWAAELNRELTLPGAVLRGQNEVFDDMALDDIQRTAALAALHNPFVMIRGGAGTGKTHIIAAISKAAAVAGLRVRIVTIAGKAADRAREAMVQYGAASEASTIHKALGYMGPKRGFTVERFDEDILVIDEASMLPNVILWELIRRLKPGARLVLVGDEMQLPPVGYGAPYADFLKFKLPEVHVAKNYRQKDVQGILEIAEGIRNRRRVKQDESCVEMVLGLADNTLETFTDLCKRYGGKNFDDWQAITWRNADVERFNLEAQALINPYGEALIEVAFWSFGTVEGTRRPKVVGEIRAGDKIIVTKNSTALNIFNGQTGRAESIIMKQLERKDRETGEMVPYGERLPHMVVSIGTRQVAIPLEDVKDYISLGYCITVHKAQGSDWHRVIVIQPCKLRDDVARRWYYTAVTRAKTKLVIASNLTMPGFWNNAAQDAPDLPSGLLNRLRAMG